MTAKQAGFNWVQRLQQLLLLAQGMPACTTACPALFVTCPPGLLLWILLCCLMSWKIFLSSFSSLRRWELKKKDKEVQSFMPCHPCLEMQGSNHEPQLPISKLQHTML